MDWNESKGIELGIICALLDYSNNEDGLKLMKLMNTTFQNQLLDYSNNEDGLKRILLVQGPHFHHSFRLFQ